MGTEVSSSGGEATYCLKLATHHHFMPRSRMMELYLHSLIHLHDLALIFTFTYEYISSSVYGVIDEVI
jgi:hypothetical protein